MNKDAIFATLIGLGIGLLLTTIILVGPTIVKRLPNVRLPALPKITLSLPSFSFPVKTSPTPAAANAVTTRHALTINSPLPEAIEQNAEVLVSGDTNAKATIVIQGMIDDSTVTANDQGQYAGKVTVSEGKNILTVTSYTADNATSETQQVTVYYTPEQW